jgi:hypothetical protein
LLPFAQVPKLWRIYLEAGQPLTHVGRFIGVSLSRAYVQGCHDRRDVRGPG